MSQEDVEAVEVAAEGCVVEGGGEVGLLFHTRTGCDQDFESFGTSVVGRLMEEKEKMRRRAGILYLTSIFCFVYVFAFVLMIVKSIPCAK